MKTVFILLSMTMCFFLFAQIQAENIEVPNMALLKISFCACQCCEKNANCVRHQDIPADFNCEENKCNIEFCDIWAKLKCSKECLCDACKDELKKDYRCIDFKEKPAHCKCDEKYSCDVDATVMEINKRLSFMEEGNTCNIPCYCQKCQGNVPRQIYANCLTVGEPDASCKCNEMDMKCLVQSEMKDVTVKNEEEDLPDMEMFATEFDEEEECKLTCFCIKCGSKSEKVKESCKQLKPDGIFRDDCNCDPTTIDCPTDEEVDKLSDHDAAMCKISCFCRQCKHDPRMGGMIEESCKQNKTPPEGCKCETEDCDLLDKLNKVNDQINKKKKRKQEL